MMSPAVARPEPRRVGSWRIRDFAMWPRMIPGMEANGPRMQVPIEHESDAMARPEVVPAVAPAAVARAGPGTGTGRGAGVCGGAEGARSSVRGRDAAWEAPGAGGGGGDGVRGASDGFGEGAAADPSG